MSKMRELMRAKKAAIASKGNDFKPYAFKPGKTLFRILPSWKEPTEDGQPLEFWADFGQHWIKEKKEGKPIAVMPCPKASYGKDCRVCDMLEHGLVEAKTSSDTVFEELLKESKAQQKYLMNCLILNDKDLKDTPVVVAVGAQAFGQIITIWENLDDEGMDLIDLKEGFNLIINREGSGFDTTYTVQTNPRGASAVADTAKLDLITNLDELVAAEFARGAENKALIAMSKVVGIAPPTAGEYVVGARPALPSSVGDDAIETVSADNLGSMDEIEDGEILSDLEMAELDEDITLTVGKAAETVAPKKATAASTATAKKAAPAKEPTPPADDFDDILNELEGLEADLG